MGMPDGKDWEKMYSYYPDRQFQLPKPKYCRTKSDIGHIVKAYQLPVFYETELKLWKENPYYKGLHLQPFLYHNRQKHLERHKNAYQLTDAELLRGFKISGIRSGYTVFDPVLMQNVIQKYGIQSVYDPCAGWGERLLCCAQMNVQYQGVDINHKLKKGYQRIIQDYGFTEQTFCVNDSSKGFHGSACDAIITCPPYFDTEIYSNKGAENFSYEVFVKWWSDVVKWCLVGDPKYFCFQINQKYKDDMAQCVTEHGFRLIEQLDMPVRSSHFHREVGGIVKKKEFESMLVFERI